MNAIHHTAAESQIEHVAKMGHELGTVYHALWQQVALLHHKWAEYVVLFGTKESRVALLNEVAPSFTRLVQDALWENVLLHIARLTDSPRSVGKPNLTIRTLAALVSHCETKVVVESRIAEALTASEFSRDWRNRHIAHRDLHLALEQGAEPLKPASGMKVAEALKALAVVLNAVSAHYLESTTFFDYGDTRGGAMSLLYVLDSGLSAERAKRERRKSGIYNPSDYESRNL